MRGTAYMSWRNDTNLFCLYRNGVFFLWPLSIKNNIVLYHMDSAPLYHVDFPQLHHIGFHDIYYSAWSSGSYVSPTCPFLAGALTKVLNWKASSSTLGSSLCPNQCRRGGRKTASSWLLFIQFITFLWYDILTTRINMVQWN